MKRCFAILLILALGVQLSSAKVIPVEKARQRAASFFSAAEVATRSVSPGDFKLLGTFPEIETRSADEAPAMYIFERETGGYAVVSADDVARPVLAYSLNASFPSWNEIPENMMDMLKWYADIIGFARSKGWAPFPETRANAGLDPANTVQLKTVHWDQRSPFNNLVKEVEGEKPSIGNIPASIATIMKYHEWPKKGTGTIPSYDYTYNDKQYHVDGITLGHAYDWNLIQDFPDWYQYSIDPPPYTEEEATELSRLFYDVAVMCQAKFSPYGSSSNPNSALKLTQYFDYDKSMVFLNRERYQAEEWEGFVKRDIDDGLPVLFKSFVIDGYNGRYFSCNFASGSTIMHNHGHDLYSEWKNFFILTPIDGHEEDLIIYYSDQFATFHIMPNQGKSASTDDISVLNGILTIPHDYHKGMSFTLRSNSSTTRLVKH